MLCMIIHNHNEEANWIVSQTINQPWSIITKIQLINPALEPIGSYEETKEKDEI